MVNAMDKNQPIRHLLQWRHTTCGYHAIHYSSRGGLSVDNLSTQSPLKVGELEFLRAKVDDPGWHYQRLNDFIESYKFPKLMMGMPMTLLRKITAQRIVARCCALISIQPIKNSDALLLDKQITGKYTQC
jgi:hypothetical protein